MIEIGSYNELTIDTLSDYGLYLSNGEGNRVLLPRRYVTPLMRRGERIRVFVYTDSEDRPVATTEAPRACVGQVAVMECVSVSDAGAFLDWGLSGKHLFVPFKEQKIRMRPGGEYAVYVYLDERTGRPVASMRLGRFIGKSVPQLRGGDTVEVTVVSQTPIGWRVVVDDRYWGIIYSDQTYVNVQPGLQSPARVKHVRPDGKIDVTLSAPESERLTTLAGRILSLMRRSGGRCPVGENSNPERIASLLQCSKKDFKKAVARLYSKRIINLDDGTPVLTEEGK